MNAPRMFGRKLWTLQLDIGWSTDKGWHFIIDIRFFVKDEETT